MIGTKKFIQSIRIRNLLSFGTDSAELELHSLNVLIGPNGSGKSNFLEAIGLLQAAPIDLTAPFRGKGGGGIQEWLWKGAEDIPVAEIDATIEYPPLSFKNTLLRHKLSFTMTGQKFDIVDEIIEDECTLDSNLKDVVYYYPQQQHNSALNVLIAAEERDHHSKPKQIIQPFAPADMTPNQSILSQLKSANDYPEITYLGRQYGQIRLYREWNLGLNTPFRRPQPTDLPDDFLEEDASNLVLVLNSLEYIPTVRTLILKHLATFHEAFDRLTFKVQGGTVQLFLHERFSEDDGKTKSGMIPATRLSDGTMRFLCLLAICCHPTPPPLICIEEPEIGLHPDIIPLVAELLISASHRTQLIVTTHSDILIDALTEVPEAVVVCDKIEGSTKMQRLQADQLKQWLDKYRLGQLWLRGDLGGTRW